jgi:hypothetical protein
VLLTEKIFENPIIEGLLRQAVIDDVNREAERWEEINKNSPPVQFSRRHNRRMKAIFAETKRLINKREIHDEIPIRLRRFARTLAYAAAVVIIAFNILILTIPTVRAAAGEAIVNFFDKYVSFSPYPNDESEIFNSELRPIYIPSGYTETSSSILGEVVLILYDNEAGDILSFSYGSTDDLLQVNNENVDYSEVVIDNIIYYVFIANSIDYVNMVVWEKDNLRFSVDGNIPTDELIKIAASVK